MRSLEPEGRRIVKAILWSLAAALLIASFRDCQASGSVVLAMLSENVSRQLPHTELAWDPVAYDEAECVLSLEECALLGYRVYRREPATPERPEAVWLLDEVPCWSEWEIIDDVLTKVGHTCPTGVVIPFLAGPEVCVRAYNTFGQSRECSNWEPGGSNPVLCFEPIEVPCF